MDIRADARVGASERVLDIRRSFPAVAAGHLRRGRARTSVGGHHQCVHDRRCPNPSTMTCPAGQICVVRAGGAISTECVSNSCGTSAISCDCLQSCSGDCTVLGTSVGSVAIYCNTCPQATCP